MGSSQCAACCRCPHRPIDAMLNAYATDHGNQHAQYVTRRLSCRFVLSGKKTTRSMVFRKIWRQMLRERQTVARCTEERVMRDMGLRGVTRGKAVKTTHADPSNANPRDLVKRQFTADRPQPALGGRFHLRFNLAGVCVRRFHRGCLLPVYRWLACRSAHAHGVCPRCARTSTSQPSA